MDGRARLLDLSLLDLTEVPKELLLTVAGLLTVTTLNLAHNQLAFLPEEIKFITCALGLWAEAIGGERGRGKGGEVLDC